MAQLNSDVGRQNIPAIAVRVLFTIEKGQTCAEDKCGSPAFMRRMVKGAASVQNP